MNIYDPAETLRRLRENHLALEPYDQHLLLALSIGLSADEISPLVFRAERTVRRDIQRLRDLIAMPAGIGGGRMRLSAGGRASMAPADRAASTRRATPSGGAGCSIS